MSHQPKRSKTLEELLDGSTERPPRTLKYAKQGIKNSHDLAKFLSAMMTDLIDGRVAPKAGKAACKEAFDIIYHPEHPEQFKGKQSVTTNTTKEQERKN
jgi:hypothetical protein